MGKRTDIKSILIIGAGPIIIKNTTSRWLWLKLCAIWPKASCLPSLARPLPL